MTSSGISIGGVLGSLGSLGSAVGAFNKISNFIGSFK
jgi:hypothetical protein